MDSKCAPTVWRFIVLQGWPVSSSGKSFKDATWVVASGEAGKMTAQLDTGSDARPAYLIVVAGGKRYEHSHRNVILPTYEITGVRAT